MQQKTFKIADLGKGPSLGSKEREEEEIRNILILIKMVA